MLNQKYGDMLATQAHCTIAAVVQIPPSWFSGVSAIGERRLGRVLVKAAAIT